MSCERDQVNQNGDTITTFLRRFWLLLSIFGLLGITSGVATALVSPTSYTAELRLGVGSQDLAAQTVPGFTASLEDLASSYARYLNDSSENVKRLTASAGLPTETQYSIDASPIPSSSVIRIEATATQPRAAVALAIASSKQLESALDATSDNLKDAEAQLAATAEAAADAGGRQSEAQQNLTEAIDRNASSQAISRLRAQLTSLTAEVSVDQAKQQAAASRYQNLYVNGGTIGVSVIRSASVVSTSTTSTLQRGAVLGLTGGLALGGLVAFVFQRRRAALELRS